MSDYTQDYPKAEKSIKNASNLQIKASSGDNKSMRELKKELTNNKKLYESLATQKKQYEQGRNTEGMTDAEK